MVKTDTHPEATGAAPTGSTIVPQYTERHMIFYNVTSREIRDLSLIGGAALMFFSIGAFAASTAISLYEGAVFALPGQVSAKGEILSTYGTSAAAIIACAFFILGVIALIVRARDIGEIKSESKQIIVPVRIPTDGAKAAVEAPL